MMRAKDERLVKFGKLANIFLAGCGVVCLLVLVYLLYHYSWTEERSFTSRTGAIAYYGFPVIIAVLCFVSLRLRPSHKISIALLLFSTAVSAYGLETALSLWSSLPPDISESTIRVIKAARGLGIDFDPRTKLQIVADLRKKGIEAYPSVVPVEFLGKRKSILEIDGKEVLPLGGVSRKLSVLCNDGRYVTYESDEHGFHNPVGMWRNGEVDIAALGDSFTQGFCVRSEKNFVALIRNLCPKTLNLGSAGNGPLLMLATLKEYAELLKPKIVLWFYYEGNDLFELRRERDYPILLRYLERGFNQELIRQQIDIDRALGIYIENLRSTSRSLRILADSVAAIKDTSELLGRTRQIIKLSHLRHRLGLIYGEYDIPRQHQPSEYAEVSDLFQKVLLEARDSVNSWGGKLYFVYLPTWARYGSSATFTGHRAPVLALVKSLGIPIIDIHEVFQSEMDPLGLFPWRHLYYAHYTERGNELVAQEVVRSIFHTQRGLQKLSSFHAKCQ